MKWLRRLFCLPEPVPLPLDERHDENGHSLRDVLTRLETAEDRVRAIELLRRQRDARRHVG